VVALEVGAKHLNKHSTMAAKNPLMIRRATHPLMIDQGRRTKDSAEGAPDAPPQHSPLAPRHSPFVIRHSSFVIRHSSFVIRHSSSVIRHPSFVIRHSKFKIQNSKFIFHSSAPTGQNIPAQVIALGFQSAINPALPRAKHPPSSLLLRLGS
jgi:hypothetical protein